MKKRIDFVTNSSSASYLVVFKKDKFDENIPQSNKYIVGRKGELEFLRHYEIMRSFDDKLNFLSILAIDKDKNVKEQKDLDGYFDYFNDRQKESLKKKWTSILDDVFFEHIGTHLEFSYLEGLMNADRTEIDHQSNWFENVGVIRLFESPENVKRFLFNKKSILITSDDGDGIEERCDFDKKLYDIYTIWDEEE